MGESSPHIEALDSESNHEVSELVTVDQAIDTPGASSPPAFNDNSNDSASTLFLDDDSSRANLVEAVEEDNASAPISSDDFQQESPGFEPEHTKEQSPSREPPTKLRRLTTPKKRERDDDGDGETCPICLDAWGNSGEHRLVALRCGHLFGAECVERWLRAQPLKTRSCPTCKSRAALRDVRFIYARRLVAADTSQLTALRRELDDLRAEKSRIELELQQSRAACRARSLELDELRRGLARAPPRAAPARNWRFALEKNLELCREGGCRVLTYDCRTYELYVSQKSANSLFPGYGVRRVGCVDYRAGQFVHLHTKPIRDLSYSAERDALLSVGLDGNARVVERGIPCASIQCGAPLWSCSWDGERAEHLYVGAAAGAVYHYDLRNSSAPVRRLANPSDLSPVVALRSTDVGLLACQLNSCRVWAGAEAHALAVEGPLMSLDYEAQSRRVLVAGRARVWVWRAGADGALEVERTWGGAARAASMSRAGWVRAAGALWAAAHSEGEAALVLHGVEGARSAALPAAEPALDVCAAEVHGQTLLAALSASRLRLYKAVPTDT